MRGTYPATRKNGAAVLQRTTFETSRAVEYFDHRELEAQTGQPAHMLLAVEAKELTDNALDACEHKRIAPRINVTV